MNETVKGKTKFPWKILWLSFFLIWTALPARTLSAAPKAELWPKWQTHDPGSHIRVDHHLWNRFLGTYLITDHPSGINRMRYASVSAEDKNALAGYIETLETVRVPELNRMEQKAYWINLYNALTVKVILDHYPIASIRDIDISPGWFSDGPWGAKLVKIEGADVALDDIEHKILRPIWKDNRIHYAVNCASFGCPNLQGEAFTKDNTERLLDQGAKDYVNHDRGVMIGKNKLTLSNIYKWFQEDFGGSEEGVIKHIRKFAEKPLAETLGAFDGKIRYDYDWKLNE